MYAENGPDFGAASDGMRDQPSFHIFGLRFSLHAFSYN